jgi:hypothetical protein
VHEAVPPHGTLLVKSGTDFRELSVVTFELPDGPRGGGGGGDAPSSIGGGGAAARRPPRMAARRVEVTGALPQDGETAAVVAEYAALMGSRMDTVIGATAVDLDGRFTTVGGEGALVLAATATWGRRLGSPNAGRASPRPLPPMPPAPANPPQVRRRESNLGNFFTEVLRRACDVEVVLLNGGTFRCASALVQAAPASRPAFFTPPARPCPC